MTTRRSAAHALAEHRLGFVAVQRQRWAVAVIAEIILPPQLVERSQPEAPGAAVAGRRRIGREGREGDDRLDVPLRPGPAAGHLRASGSGRQPALQCRESRATGRGGKGWGRRHAVQRGVRTTGTEALVPVVPAGTEVSKIAMSGRAA